VEVLCKNCKAKFKIADDKLPAGQMVSLKCPKCKSKIEIKTTVDIDKGASDIYDVSEKTFDSVEEWVGIALICEQDAGLREKIRSTIQRMGYHPLGRPESARDAMKYMRFRVFDLIVLDENFEGGNPESNHVLQYLGHQPMNTRRNIFVVLLGNSFRTADNMMAFNRSVNLVVNLKDVDELEEVLRRSLTEYEEFYSVLKGSLKKMGRA
jgi:predicted Zn finger-like uncharacterized protein